MSRQSRSIWHIDNLEVLIIYTTQSIFFQMQQHSIFVIFMRIILDSSSSCFECIIWHSNNTE